MKLFLETGNTLILYSPQLIFVISHLAIPGSNCHLCSFLCCFFIRVEEKTRRVALNCDFFKLRKKVSKLIKNK